MLPAALLLRIRIILFTSGPEQNRNQCKGYESQQRNGDEAEKVQVIRIAGDSDRTRSHTAQRRDLLLGIMKDRNTSPDQTERQHIRDNAFIAPVGRYAEQEQLWIHKDPLKPAKLARLIFQYLAEIKAPRHRNYRYKPGQIQAVPSAECGK